MKIKDCLVMIGLMMVVGFLFSQEAHAQCGSYSTFNTADTVSLATIDRISISQQYNNSLIKLIEVKLSDGYLGSQAFTCKSATFWVYLTTQDDSDLGFIHSQLLTAMAMGYKVRFGVGSDGRAIIDGYNPPLEISR